MYVDNAGECGSCHSLCKTCVGPRETDCVTCFHGTFLDMSGSCVDACPAGQYPSSSGERVCLPCNNMCLLCSGGDDADCRSCRPGLHLDNGHCVASCPHGKYAASTGRCEPCHASCAGCLGSSDKDCSSCKPGMFLLDYACYGRCPDGYYAEEVDGQMTCVTCYHSCNTCSGDGPNKCLSCQSDFILREHICYEPCSDSEYFNRFKQMCARCHSNCATCSGPSESSCTSCSDGYGLDGPRSRCVPCCPHHDDPTMHGCCTCDHQHST
ncbi:PREDICTED: proprotein convertase subtilisin/kexin type 5-like [Priapulus caudatus]|uniref:Proprotein convertase subtilisin/kexin type 5-like n=1 Tax=Priapulus caudatus TaxID=37621 RepID=A0ABM1EZ47_PRICU|nr:PREDICTED: proprotein convertase subtilisin/kexin type 5-like [Priapulus caudatus]